jgi:cytochrome c-type biogenesis protein CcmH/NrfF
MNLRNAWLWSAPVVLLIAGVWVAVRVLRRRSALAGTDQSEIE